MLEFEIIRVGAALIDTLGDIVGLGVYKADPLVAGEHGLAQLGSALDAVP